MCNAAFARFMGLVGDEQLRLDPYRVLQAPRLNALKLVFGALRPFIGNWEELTDCMLDRARREVAMDRDPVRRRILEE